MKAVGKVLAYIIFTIIGFVVVFIVVFLVSDRIARATNQSNFEGARDYGVALIAFLCSFAGAAGGIYLCNRIFVKRPIEDASKRRT